MVTYLHNSVNIMFEGLKISKYLTCNFDVKMII